MSPVSAIFRPLQTDPPGYIDRLAELISERRVSVLTGAGISTDSGIPDYRGPQGSLTRRAPIRYHEFVHSAEDRRRYWARSYRGWPYMRDRQPNISHEIVTRLQRAGHFGPVITQNVDGLHRSAGSDPVLELHGALDAVVCLHCGRRRDREEIQTEMEAQNPGRRDHAIEIAPDGDAELDPDHIREFVPPVCDHCGGALKPDVVLFGESVPKSRVDRAFSIVDASQMLLVLGSSLTVYSGYRFAERAVATGKPVVLVNLGTTRADPIASLKIDAPLAPTLSDLADRLRASREPPARPPRRETPPKAP